MVSVFQRSCLSAVVAVLLFIVSAAAADGWIKIDSPNFELIGNASEFQISVIAQRLERFRTAVHKLFLIEDRAGRSKIRVVVFKDSASFRPFKPKLADGTSDDAVSGYFQAGEDIDYIAVAADSSFSDIFHEYSHALLANKFVPRDIPPWLNEGLAEYLKTFHEVDDKSVEFGSIHQQHLQTLRANQLMPWDRLLRLDNFTLQQSGRSERSVFYAQSWALMNFLIGKKGETSVNEIVESLSKPQNVSAVKIDGQEIAVIDSGVRDLISQKPVIFATRRLQSESRSLSLTQVALSDAKSNAYLGDLLYHLRDNAAESYVLKSLAAEPNLVMANATLGLIRLRQRKFGDAKMLFEKALASEQKNYLVNYYYAFLISRESMDEFGNIERLPADAARKMRFYLNASISLNPEFADSYRLLALVGLITDDNLESALSSALRAQSLQPADDDGAILVARIYARLNKFVEAKQVAEKVFRRSANTYSRKEAAAIIAASDEMIAASNTGKRFSVGVNTNEPVQPVILKWRDLTPEQFAKIQEEREINNVNILLERPAAGESLALGFVDQVACRDGLINYRLRTADGVLRLTTRNFDELKIKVLTPGTRSFVFRCGASFSSELTVARYSPANTRADNAGTLSSITFVPKNFRLKPLEQIAREPLIIIEGLPSSNLDENLKTSEAERIEMDRVFRESQIDEINDQLRPPEANESRTIAVPEAIECRDEMMFISARVGDVLRTFRAPINNTIYVKSFSPDTGIIEIGCRSKLPPVTAVITYRETKSADGRQDLVAIEFVPKAFRFK